MFKHQLVGGLEISVSVLVLVTACAVGEIGGVPEGARLGPEASDPEVGNEVSPLVCPEASADVSAISGWQGSEGSLPADGALRLEFKARPTAADLDGLVAVGAQDIDDFPKAAIAVRFAEDGFVDARDGGIYNSDVSYPYDPGVWYSVSASADIQSETYDVEIGRCGEPQQKLIENASFRDGANVSGQLSAWAVWSSQSAALEVSTPAWMASGGCMPSTCENLGHVCGQPSDGCGGTLTCGACGNGETCLSGACMDESVSPPPCQPATCQTLSAECGLQSDGCGGTLSCGSCSGGEMCSSGACIDAPPNSPPPPPAGTPYGHVVPSDVGNTIGVGVVAAVPTAPYTGPTTVSADDTLIENVVITDELRITGDNVTLRNVIIDVTSWNGIFFVGANNARLEYSRIHNGLDGKAIRVDDLTEIHIENNEITGGQAFFFFTLTLDEIYIENNYMHHVVGDSTAHTDGFQWYLSTNNEDFYIRGNYMAANNPDIGMTDLLVITDATANVLFENNYFEVFGWYTHRVHNNSGEFTFRYNIYAQEFKAAFPAAGSPAGAITYDPSTPNPNSVYRCNGYEDGDFIEQAYVIGTAPLTHDITGCPSYP